MDAFIKISAASIGAYLVIVDAIDNKAAGFYQLFGFLPFVSHNQKMYLPVATVKQLMNNQ